MSDNEFCVSVVIPVYNAAKYIREAVESALALDDVKEIVLVEDGSADNGWEACKELEKEYRKVRLYQHPNKENRGAGASRNLGIEKATCDYIAFLDADDWYLPNRFINSRKIFLRDNNIDGVYEATGFYDESTRSLNTGRLTTLKEVVNSDDLLFTLLKIDGGRFTTDAITIRKTILEKSGLFDESLRLHQDTHLWLRLAQVGKLVHGELKQPVAIRRTHAQNRIQHQNNQSRSLLFIKSFEWFEQQDKVDPRAFRILFNRYVGALRKNLISKAIFAIGYISKRPGIVKRLL